jgi:hypothetical protein
MELQSFDANKTTVFLQSLTISLLVGILAVICQEMVFSIMANMLLIINIDVHLLNK